MVLDLGPQRMEIVSHSTGNVNSKFVVRIRGVNPQGESADVTIFFTEKSMGMARASLKACGFDVDTHPLSALDSSPPMLKGNKVAIMVEEFNGKTRCSIDLNQRADKEQCDAMTKALRAAKKSNAPQEAGDIPF